MPSVAVARGWTSQSGGGAAWSGNSVALDAPQASQTRYHTDYGFAPTLHDGCRIDGIQINFNAYTSVPIPQSQQRVYANLILADGSASSQLQVTGLTTSAVNYQLGGSTNLWGFSSIPPSRLIGSGTSGFRAAIQAHNIDTFYPVTNTVGDVTVTVYYTDNGRPSFMQFAF